MIPTQVLDIAREETRTRGGALNIEAIDAARQIIDELAQAAEAALALTTKSSTKARTDAGKRLRAAIDGYYGRSADSGYRVLD